MNTMEKQKEVFAKVQVSDIGFRLIECMAEISNVPAQHIAQQCLVTGLKAVWSAYMEEARYIFYANQKLKTCEPGGTQAFSGNDSEESLTNYGTNSK